MEKPGTTDPYDWRLRDEALYSPEDRPTSRQEPDPAQRAFVPDPLYFFPEQPVSEARARWILQQGSSEEKAWVISHLLCYAQWNDIWTYVSRSEVRETFSQLELPPRLRAAWARLLKLPPANHP